MSCRYCDNNGKSRLWINSSDNRMKMKLSKKHNGRTHKNLRMIVQGNSWSDSGNPEKRKSCVFKFNYCPMCGKELKGD